MTKFFAALTALLATPLVSPGAQAQAATAIAGYHCEVLMITDKTTIEESFELPAGQPASHGGAPTTYTKDDYTVAVSADGKWLNIQWEKAGQLLAAGSFVLGNLSDSPRVALMYNPANTEEQVSLNCEPK